jgi:hypothetical protein
MGVILVLYTVLNILVFSFVVLFARATRTRARANERVDLEDNSIIAEEWDLVLRLQCLPSGCSRVVSEPPRPRKDVCCEICAASFMERYWQERLSNSTFDNDGSVRRARSSADRTRHVESNLISLDFPAPGKVMPRARRGDAGCQEFAHGRRLYAAGIGCVLVGALIGVLTPFIIAGYLLVVVGIGALVVGAASGSL